MSIGLKGFNNVILECSINRYDNRFEVFDDIQNKIVLFPIVSFFSFPWASLKKLLSWFFSAALMYKIFSTAGVYLPCFLILALVTFKAAFDLLTLLLVG